MDFVEMDGMDKVFGDDIELEDYDISEVVDFYFRLGPPDRAYMNEVKEKWGKKNELV